jgi:DNA-binding NarL/FixJ family response regulator
MTLKVFAFEDEDEWLQKIKDALKYVSPENQKRYGIKSIELKHASSKEEALQLLRKAEKEGRLPDLILLDLKLPLEKGGAAQDKIGIEILNEAQRINAAKEVLVYSIVEDFELAVDAFSGGAIDFIRKSRVTEEELLIRVLASGARLLARENARLLEQRLKDLVPYAETGLAHRLGVCFSRFVQSVVNESEGLEEGLKERWGLDMRRDSQDSQVRHLSEMQGAIQQAKRDWTDIVSSLIGGEETPGTCVIEDALKDIHNELMPSIALNHVELTVNWKGETLVRTFRDEVDDVKAVLKEILLGALSEEVPAKTSGGTIDVKVITNDGRAEVQFKDSFARIDDRAACSINRGVIIPPGRAFGRAWGLSVAQHLALRGGGRLKVESNGNGNVIIYSIPLADHAKSPSDR